MLGRCVVRANRKIKPTIAETATDRKIPQALATRAPTVSSATWADASYPVYVQFACRSEKKNAKNNGYVAAAPYFRCRKPRLLSHEPAVSSGWTANRFNPD